MSGTPKVSIIIAAYNRAQLLPATIESALQQRFQDFEIIVVDDGSTDDTEQALQPYRDRLVYFRQENRGPSAARNAGVRVARAPWIAIQDSDDLCAPNYLDSLYGFASVHQDCGMVFANGAYLGGKEHNRETIIPSPKSSRLAAQGVRLEDLFEKSIVRLQASLISKTCYDAIGGHDEGLRISMDLDLALRIFMRYPVAYLDDVVFYYRKHEENISRNEEARLTENIQVIEKLLREHPAALEMLGARSVARRIAYRYYRLAKSRWKRNEYGAARKAIATALSHTPYSLKYRMYQYGWGMLAR